METTPPEPRDRRRKWAWRLAAVLAMGAMLLALLGMHRSGWRGAFAHVASLPPTTIVLMLAASFAQIVALATRFWAMFPRCLRPSWGWGARAFGFGQWANAWLPGRAGDVLRVVTLGERRRGPIAVEATGVVLAEKAIDVVTLAGLVLLFAPALVLELGAGALRSAWVGGAVLLFLVFASAVAHRLWPRVFDRVRGAVGATWRAARHVLTPAPLLAGLALGCVSWFAEAWSFALVSGPLGVHLTMGRAFVALLALNMGIAVPVSVANVGAYEAATAAGLATFGVPVPQALAIGAMHHAVQVATAGAFALVFWLHDRVVKLPARA